jgi:hypothetical protein
MSQHIKLTMIIVIQFYILSRSLDLQIIFLEITNGDKKKTKQEEKIDENLKQKYLFCSLVHPLKKIRFRR